MTLNINTCVYCNLHRMRYIILKHLNLNRINDTDINIGLRYILCHDLYRTPAHKSVHALIFEDY